MKKPLSIGILGAANIAQRAVIEPAQKLEGIEVLAVAARDQAKAEQFAQNHGIPLIFPSYDALIESDRIDAIYIPLANHLHTPWLVNLPKRRSLF